MVLRGRARRSQRQRHLLTTKSCLLNPCATPSSRKDHERQRLCDYLGVKSVLWLGDGSRRRHRRPCGRHPPRCVDRTSVRLTVIGEDETMPHDPWRQMSISSTP